MCDLIKVEGLFFLLALSFLVIKLVGVIDLLFESVSECAHVREQEQL